MSAVLDKAVVLSLNSAWQPIGWRTVKDAITSMTGGGKNPAAMALDITLDDKGDILHVVPVGWDAWYELPVRPGDLFIQTKDKVIRAPTAIINSNYSKMHLKAPRLTKEAILERDGYRCAYTGQKLPKSRLNVDHVIPRHRGGKDTWENLVASDREVNSKKGNRLNEEIGLKLKIKPIAPKSMPVSFAIREPRRPEHAPFLKHT
jgi:5-methylcytosine-specific restriction endonuclease McrA